MQLSEEKLGLGVGYAASMLAAWGLTARFPALASSLTTVVGGLTGLYAIFCGAHVTNKWVQGKNGGGDAPEETDQDVDASPFVEPHPEHNGKE